jgi:hypothetical protein
MVAVVLRVYGNMGTGNGSATQPRNRVSDRFQPERIQPPPSPPQSRSRSVITEMIAILRVSSDSKSNVSSRLPYQPSIAF